MAWLTLYEKKLDDGGSILIRRQVTLDPLTERLCGYLEQIADFLRDDVITAEYAYGLVGRMLTHLEKDMPVADEHEGMKW